MSYFGSVGIKDGPNLGAFSFLRVADPVTLFDSKCNYDTSPLLWETVLAGAATEVYLPNESSVRLRTTVANGDSAIRQTRSYFRYQPGKSQLCLLTFVMAAPQTNLRQRIGYFDAQNGIFLEQNGSAVSVVRRTYVSGAAIDNSVAKASWNMDPMDGTGPSGVTLDLTKSQILIIDFQWLGVGRIRVGFDIDGQIYYCHEFLNANSLATVYMTTPTLPLRYEIVNTGVVGSATNDMRAICGAVISEGGIESGRGYPFAASNGTTTIGVTTRRAVLSIRPAATFAGITNRITIDPQGFGFYVGTNDCYWEIVYGGTLGGVPVWNAANASSAVQFDVAGTTVTGGITLLSGHGVAGAGALRQVSRIETPSRYPVVLDAAGANPKLLSLVCTSMGGTSNIAGSMSWIEYH